MANDYHRVWVGNLPDRIDEELLYELFLQAGPVEDVVLPRYPDGRPKPFAFITYKHKCSAPYSKELFKGTTLLGKEILIEPKAMELPERNDNEGYAGLNSLRGFSGGVAMRGHDDLSKPYKMSKDFSNPYGVGMDLYPSVKTKTVDNMPSPMIPDFNMLLALGQQLQNPYASAVTVGMGSSSLYPSQALDPVMSKSRSDSHGTGNNFHSRNRDGGRDRDRFEKETRDNYRSKSNARSQGRDNDRDHFEKQGRENFGDRNPIDFRNHDSDNSRNRYDKNHPYRDNKRDDRRHGHSFSRNNPGYSRYRERK